MIEINFFEKKKKNYSPLILLAVFIVGLILIGAYLLVLNTTLVNQHEQNMAKINQQQPIITELQQNQAIFNQVEQLNNQLETLVDHQYPTPFLYETFADLLPESEALYLLNYQFSINEGLQITVQLDGLEQVAAIHRSLTDLAFVTNVDLELVDLVNQDQRHYVANIQLVIDRDQISEVAADD